MSKRDRGEGNTSPRVHIVSERDDWILGRYTRILQRELGWTTSRQPRTNVDVNYYLSYLGLNVGTRPPTKSMAWFTHLEEDEKSQHPNSKTRRWDWVAKVVDLRLVQAQKYGRLLEKNGPTKQILTPVNTRQFKPRPLRVGVAGRVYSHPSRKGEDLVGRLHKSGLFEVVASGSGWPCPTRMYDWNQMQTFYQGLDVFVITSKVEGGPDTVLEALACGIPVIGPRDVGMLDEFQILTYDKGDYQSLLARLKAIDMARKKRAQAVAHRTEQFWARQHLDAARSLM